MNWLYHGITFLFKPPKQLAEEFIRIYRVIALSTVMAVLLHGLYIPIYASLGVYILAYYNIFSVICYVVAFLTNQHGFLRVAILLMGVEVTAYSCLGSFVLGWGGGIHYFMLIIPVLVAIYPTNRHAFKITTIFVYFIFYGILYHVTFNHPPIIVLTAEQIAPLFYINSFVYIMLIAGGVYYYSFEVKRAEDSLQSKTDELETANTTLHSTLKELKRAQSQIVIQEKVASLGELTAGIAHEMKNPLNFISNFTELSKELIDEWIDLANRSYSSDPASKVSETTQEEMQEIAHTIQGNLDKVLYHSKHIDSIVQAMQELSRGTSTHRESVQINDVFYQYTEIAFRSYQLNPDSTPITIEYYLASDLPMIKVNVANIGRVFINLINNAMFALQSYQSTDTRYQPCITLHSKQVDKVVELRIRDNGPGIPASIQDKVFDPFFTNKPPGTGHTGLGLSISHEIVVQEHRGILRFETKPDEYTEFIISLPLENETGHTN
jgi:signal transduction histidine kinase